MQAARAETGGELEAALDMAFAHDGPVFVDVAVESLAEVIPPVFNWLRKTGVEPLNVGGAPLALAPEPAE
jgi:acetolactate synthase-1/2/3 large subunit